MRTPPLRITDECGNTLHVPRRDFPETLTFLKNSPSASYSDLVETLSSPAIGLPHTPALYLTREFAAVIYDGEVITDGQDCLSQIQCCDKGTDPTTPEVARAVAAALRSIYPYPDTATRAEVDAQLQDALQLAAKLSREVAPRAPVHLNVSHRTFLLNRATATHRCEALGRSLYLIDAPALTRWWRRLPGDGVGNYWHSQDPYNPVNPDTTRPALLLIEGAVCVCVVADGYTSGGTFVHLNSITLPQRKGALGDHTHADLHALESLESMYRISTTAGA